MRIDRLDLIAYGKFSGQSLDLSSGDRGLHVIHGPNEAGKSTSLRALNGWLFGFDRILKDNFLHDNPKIRVGGILRDDDGTTFELIRRKSDKRSLRRGDDESDFDEDFLKDRLLGGVDKALFGRTFSLDHAALRAGGEAALKAGGEFAKILFGSGIDLASLRAYQGRLEAEIEGLFKPSGQIPSINKSLKGIEEAAKAIEAASIRGADWREKMDELARLESLSRETDLEWRGVKLQRERLARIRQAKPDLARLRIVREDLDKLADAPRLSPDFTDRRHEAERSQLEAATTLTIQAKERDRLAQAVAEIPPPSPILADAQAIEGVLADLIRHEGAEKTRDTKSRERDRHIADVESLKARLANGIDPSSLDRSGSAAETKRAILKVADRGTRSDLEMEATGVEVEAAIAALADAEAAIAETPTPPDPSGLARALKRARMLGDVFETRSQAARDLTKAEKSAATLLAKLGNPASDPLAAAGLPVPSLDILREHRDAIREADRTLEAARDQLRKNEEELAELKRAIERRAVGSDVPEVSDLAMAREARDGSWERIKAEKKPIDAPVATEFEGKIRRADELSDHLRRAADIVAERARDSTDRLQREDRVQHAQERVSDAVAAREEKVRNWLSLWTGVGIKPRSPSEMIDWASDHEKLIVAVGLIQEKRDKLSAIDASSDLALSDLDAELRPLGERTLLGESFRSAVERAEAALATAEEIGRSRIRAVADRDQKAEELDAARARRGLAETEDAAWKKSWTTVLAPLGLTGNATREDALATLEAVVELTRATQKAEELAVEIAASERDSIKFHATLNHLSSEHAPHRVGAPPDLSAAALKAALDEARAIETKRKTVEEARSKAETAIRQAEVDAERSRLALNALAREAGVRSSDELVEIERKSVEKAHRERERIAIEDRLRAIATTKTPEELEAEADETDSEDLDSTILTLEADEDRLGIESRDLTKRVATIGEEIRSKEETAREARAAEAVAVRESLMGALETDVERYVHLKLSLAVLQGAIEDFRTANEGPVLARAGEHFARLTQGSFTGLRTDLDDKNELVVLGVRPDGASRVGVAGMSTGTVDALYLAIKLASLEHHLRTRTPLPLILDDLLIQLDDDRAIAALECLAELSHKTQVLFFTHHDHMVDLARSRLSPEVLFVHHLHRTRVGVNGSA